MMIFVRVVAVLHLAAYLGIMWYGWQSYKLLRKPSWKVMGIGFAILLLYRVRQLARQVVVDYPIDTENTVLPFIGAIFLLIAFRMLCAEHHVLIKKLVQPLPLLSGAQPIEFWQNAFRVIVREELANAKAADPK